MAVAGPHDDAVVDHVHKFGKSYWLEAPVQSAAERKSLHSRHKLTFAPHCQNIKFASIKTVRSDLFIIFEKNY